MTDNKLIICNRNTPGWQMWKKKIENLRKPLPWPVYQLRFWDGATPNWVPQAFLVKSLWTLWFLLKFESASIFTHIIVYLIIMCILQLPSDQT